MKRIFLRLKQPLRNERGEITFFACFFVVGIVGQMAAHRQMVIMEQMLMLPASPQMPKKNIPK